MINERERSTWRVTWPPSPYKTINSGTSHVTLRVA